MLGAHQATPLGTSLPFLSDPLLAPALTMGWGRGRVGVGRVEGGKHVDAPKTRASAAEPPVLRAFLPRARCPCSQNAVRRSERLKWTFPQPRSQRQVIF